MADAGWSPPASLRATLAAEAWVEAVLAYEAVLASAQAERGAIPAAHAERIAEACAAPDALGVSGLDPVPSVVAALREAVGPPVAADVHRGATERDAADTASALVARRAVTQIDGDLEAAQRRLPAGSAAAVAGARSELAGVPFACLAGHDVERLVAAGLGLSAGDGDPEALPAALGHTAAVIAGIGEGPHVEAAGAAREHLGRLAAVTAWRRRWPLTADALLALGAAAALLRAGLREGRIVVDS